MKSVFLIAAILISSTAAFASSICPKETKTDVSCTANALVALYPFAAICISERGETLLALDAGSATDVSYFPSTMKEDVSGVTVTPTSADVAGMQLQVEKALATKIHGVLNFKMLGNSMSAKYACKYE